MFGVAATVRANEGVPVSWDRWRPPQLATRATAMSGRYRTVRIESSLIWCRQPTLKRPAEAAKSGIGAGMRVHWTMSVYAAHSRSRQDWNHNRPRVTAIGADRRPLGQHRWGRRGQAVELLGGIHRPAADDGQCRFQMFDLLVGY